MMCSELFQRAAAVFCVTFFGAMSASAGVVTLQYSGEVTSPGVPSRFAPDQPIFLRAVIDTAVLATTPTNSFPFFAGAMSVDLFTENADVPVRYSVAGDDASVFAGFAGGLSTQFFGIAPPAGAGAYDDSDEFFNVSGINLNFTRQEAGSQAAGFVNEIDLGNIVDGIVNHPESIMISANIDLVPIGGGNTISFQAEFDPANSFTAIPEPATLALVGGGLMFLGLRRFRGES